MGRQDRLCHLQSLLGPWLDILEKLQPVPAARGRGKRRGEERARASRQGFRRPWLDAFKKTQPVLVALGCAPDSVEHRDGARQQETSADDDR
jgi:hypothetical protein